MNEVWNMIKLCIVLWAFIAIKVCLGFDNDLSDVMDCHKMESCPNINITYWLYNAKYPNGIRLFESYLEISLYFEGGMNNPLKVLFHDFGGNRSTVPNSDVRPALLAIPNINVLTIDYSKLTAAPCYTESVHNAYGIGVCVSWFLTDLVYRKIVNGNQLHFIGVGIGAHLASFAANSLINFGIIVEHITALDPAKLYYLTSNRTARIDEDDALFVDVIHTDILFSGLLQPIGHVDFYPNTGVSQPNCGDVKNMSSYICNHMRASEYYAESIGSGQKFWAFGCRDLYSYIKAECKPSDNVEELGYHTRRTARGVYFLATNDRYPFAKGMDFTNMEHGLEGKTFLGDTLLQKIADLGESGLRVLTGGL